MVRSCAPLRCFRRFRYNGGGLEINQVKGGFVYVKRSVVGKNCSDLFELVFLLLKSYEMWKIFEVLGG